MRAGFVLFVLAILLFSGCADKPAPAGVPGGAVDVVRVDGNNNVAPEETGEIVGRVLDDEFRPLQAVSVSIQGLQARTKTTQDGIFYFTSVPARAYSLSFEKVGFEPKTQSVVVTAQQRSVVETIMIQIANQGAFVDDGFIFRGRINCSVRVNASGTNTNPECGQGQLQAEFDNLRQRKFDTLPGVDFILIEVDWRPTVPTVNDKLTLAIRPFEAESWKQVQGTRPIRALITPLDLVDIQKKYEKDYNRNGGQIQLMMFPGEIASQGGLAVGSTLQQEFTIYATAWYRMTPPEGYTRLPQ